MSVDESEYNEIIERLERVERAVGLRPPEELLSNGWDPNGRYWGDWQDPYPHRYKEWPE